MGNHSKPSHLPAVMRGIAVAGALGVVGLAAEVQVPAHAAEAPAVNWDPIIACESGGRADAQNPGSTASGLFQFLDSTWQRLGGSTARAKDASVSEQYAIAEKQYSLSGFAAWAASEPCWGGKTSATVKIEAAPAPAPVTSGKHDSGVTKAATGTPRHAAAAPVVTAAIEPIVDAEYDVKPGDTLWMIAKRKGGETWQDLYGKNTQVIGQNPDLILPGQHLVL